jgi:putative sigma-54 modulation protein
MEFPITITGKHLEVTEPLRAYVAEKIGRACRLLDKITSAHVTIHVEKYRHIVEVIIQSHGATLRAKEETADMYSSIDQVLEKIEVQAKRLKEKIKDHKHAPEAAGAPPPPEEAASGRPRVFVSETFAAKPLTVDEAVDELQARPDQFIVFQNARSSQVNVLYKRGDGTFGLVEPHHA